MARCIIITAYNEFPVREGIDLRKDDFIICADGGYAIAEKEGILPEVIIGDFDSFDGKVLSFVHVVCLPAEKDDTDTLFCLKYGIERGFNDFIIAGSFGGRADHTIANIQTLAYGCRSGRRVVLQDKKSMFIVISNSTINIPRREKAKLSVFAYTDKCHGVTLKGVKYILDNALLTNTFPLGVSNEFVDDEAVVSCGDGMLLVSVVIENI